MKKIQILCSFVQKHLQYFNNYLRQNFDENMSMFFPKYQGMGCEGGCAHAHVRCAVARVRAKRPLKHVCKVRAGGPFFHWSHPHTCDCTFCPLSKENLRIFLNFSLNRYKVAYFRTFYSALEHPFLFQNALFCFRMSFSISERPFSVLEHPFLFQNVLLCFRMSFLTFKTPLKML